MKRILRGEKTRQEILKRTVNIASVEGLHGLTVGRLAKELNMSKSGLYSHFGSKEELQIATVDTAREVFEQEIILPTEDAENGVAKLYAMLDAWISSIERGVFEGGCFFCAVSTEMDDRPGRVRDYVAKLTFDWVKRLEKETKLAIRLSELKKSCDVELLVFQTHGSVQEANWFYRLHKDKRAFEKSRKSILQSLELRATQIGRGVLNEINL